LPNDHNINYHINNNDTSTTETNNQKENIKPDILLLCNLFGMDYDELDDNIFIEFLKYLIKNHSEIIKLLNIIPPNKSIVNNKENDIYYLKSKIMHECELGKDSIINLYNNLYKLRYNNYEDIASGLYSMM
jgi:hypothetical protein